MNEKDEIALWYMAKINRRRNHLYEEKEYLEKLIEVSPPISQIKAQQRLERIKGIIEKKEKREEFEKVKQEDLYTEEERQKFIKGIKKGFLEGTVTLDNIDKQIREAEKYPNFVESLISILDIKAMMTGNLQDKIIGLEKYVDTAQTLTPEQYHIILDTITQTREQQKREKQIEEIIDQKYKEEQGGGQPIKEIPDDSGEER